MTPSELISEGTSLMVFGMGFVFLFLTVLVLITGMMSKIIIRYFQEPLPVNTPASVRQSVRSPPDDGELIAVISAAIRTHRARKTQKNG